MAKVKCLQVEKREQGRPKEITETQIVERKRHGAVKKTRRSYDMEEIARE